MIQLRPPRHFLKKAPVVVTLALTALVLAAPQSFASGYQPLSGYFIAEKACPAYQSKNRMTNPGTVETKAMKAYTIKGLNQKAGDYFQISIPGVPVTTERWVHVSCGIHAVQAPTVVAASAATPQPQPSSSVTPAQPSPAPQPSSSSSNSQESDNNLLALTWQPAFCESLPSKAECQELNAGRLPLAAKQLSIHGLWPQPRGVEYCGVSATDKSLDKNRLWSQLPLLPLTVSTRNALDIAMPGTLSFLQRHEWIKHGTCYYAPGGADEYFQDAMHLTALINASAVGQFFAANVGKEVQIADIRARFDQAFGAGAGDRVFFSCKRDGNRNLLQELRINLKGVIDSNAPLGPLIQAGQTTAAGCNRAVIDPAGLQ